MIKNLRTFGILAATGLYFTIAITILVTSSPILQQAANAQKTDAITNSTAITTNQTAPANLSNVKSNSNNSINSNSGNKIFYLFTAEHEGLNETKLGIPPDTFSPDVLVATEGDKLIIHFYNLDTTDRHTFTIASPYNINKDLLPGQNATVIFKAVQEGVFRFYCTYHQPTMIGQLIVLHPPTVEKIGGTDSIK